MPVQALLQGCLFRLASRHACSTSNKRQPTSNKQPTTNNQYQIPYRFDVYDDDDDSDDDDDDDDDEDNADRTGFL